MWMIIHLDRAIGHRSGWVGRLKEALAVGAMVPAVAFALLNTQQDDPTAGHTPGGSDLC